jgi:hypothetical protein
MKAMLQPSVYGRLIDRYLFNFRVDPEALRAHIPPVKWLEPRVINGFGVVSFCMIRLKGVTIWPLPPELGFDATSCAYRCAVVDSSDAGPEPSVYVLERNTNLPIASRFGAILFAGAMKMIRTSIVRTQSQVNIDLGFLDGQRLFSACVRPSPDGRSNSKLFNTDSFVDFIKGGASSYTPSTRKGLYSRVDLAEDSNYYEPVEATVEYSRLDKAWPDIDLVFDSAFRAGGGLYRLKYLGSFPARQKDSYHQIPKLAPIQF